MRVTTIPTPGDLRARLTALLARPPMAGVAAAYLFGSHAEGRAHRESDVDMAVLLDRAAYPTARERFDARLRLGGWLAAELRVPLVDVVVLNDAPPLLARRIVTVGERLACADGAAVHAFVRDVQLRAADVEPFVRRARRRILGTLRR